MPAPTPQDRAMHPTGDIPPNDWDTFTKHMWYVPRPDRIEDWPTAARCEETADLLHAHGCTSILDAAAGFGMKTLQFKRLGFEATGIDIVERSAAYGTELAAAHGLDVRFLHMAWADVPAHFREEFDAVYNDNFTNAVSREELHAAARAAYAALKPGGIALLGTRPEDEWHMSPDERVARAWKGPNHQVWWSLDTPEGHVTTLCYYERFSKGIYRHLLHLIDNKRLETSGWFDSLEWGFSDVEDVLMAVGFASVELHELPSGGYEGLAKKS